MMRKVALVLALSVIIAGGAQAINPTRSTSGTTLRFRKSAVARRLQVAQRT